MKSRWPIRRWLGVALALVFFLPLLGLIIAVMISFLSIGAPSSPLADTLNVVEANPERWTDPAWIESLQPELLDDDVRVNLYVGSDVVYSNNDTLLSNGNRVVRETTIEHHGETYRAQVSVPTDDGPPEAIMPPLLLAVMGTVLIVTLASVSILLRRNVILPLEAVGTAAVGFAQGLHAPALRPSPIREVESVNQAVRDLGQRLNEIESQREELEQQRQYFIGAIAHDLRTPVFALRGSLDALEQPFGQSPEKREHYLGIARNRLDRLERRIADLFTYTQSGLAALPAASSETALGPFLSEIAMGFESAARENEVRVVSSVQPAGLTARIDAHAMARTIENLVQNAIRHSPAHGTVELSAKVGGEEIAIAVRDHGAGFGREDLERAFEPMYRGDAARSTPGAGLGMAIATNIVEAHGGTIDAANHAEGGAVVTISLPRGQHAG